MFLRKFRRNIQMYFISYVMHKLSYFHFHSIVIQTAKLVNCDKDSTEVLALLIFLTTKLLSTCFNAHLSCICHILLSYFELYISETGPVELLQL